MSGDDEMPQCCYALLRAIALPHLSNQHKFGQPVPDNLGCQGTYHGGS